MKMVTECKHGQGHHFLMVANAAQGQINPARHLARCLARTAKARVTIATPLSSHRRLFPRSSAAAGEPDDSAEEAPLNLDGSGVVSYAPFSDGFDDGFQADSIDDTLFMERLTTIGSRTLASLALNFAKGGRPVTCVVYTILLTWAADVARDIGIPAVHYWIQSASVFAVYYHYFHGHPGFTSATDENDSSYSIELPGLPPLRKKDLPSIIAAPSPFLSPHKDIFMELDKSSKPIVLVNTFHQLEAPAIDGIPGLEMITIGPMVEKSPVLPAEAMSNEVGRDLFDEDTSGYMEWLDAQEKRSVVYVAFGSLARLTARQVDELAKGLNESDRPYLWVLRKDRRSEGVEMELKDRKGMMVEWCSQVRVLNHKAVGCFVTHSGWNSMSEALASAVPMVMLPQWMDQATNARLAEAAWGIGVRVEAGEDGVMEEAELRRCLEVVMGHGERAGEIKKKVEGWKEKVRVSLSEDGSSSKNIKAFVMNSLCLK